LRTGSNFGWPRMIPGKMLTRMMWTSSRSSGLVSSVKHCRTTSKGDLRCTERYVLVLLKSAFEGVVSLQALLHQSKVRRCIIPLRVLSHLSEARGRAVLPRGLRTRCPSMRLEDASSLARLEDTSFLARPEDALSLSRLEDASPLCEA
jgi:hypothetical protein